MTAPLTTYPDVELAALDRELLASLPLSYAHADASQPGDVALILGASDWPDRVRSRIQAGARSAVVVDPRPTELERIRSLTTIDASLVLSEPFASHPALASLAEALGGTEVLVIAASGAGHASAQLFDQLRLLRALGFSRLRSLDVTTNASSVLATLSGLRGGEQQLIRLIALTTTAHSPHHLVRGYGPTTVVTGTLYGPETARPATISKSTPGGTIIVAAPYETAHRAALRQLSSGATTSDVDGFAEDVTFLRSLL